MICSPLPQLPVCSHRRTLTLFVVLLRHEQRVQYIEIVGLIARLLHCSLKQHTLESGELLGLPAQPGQGAQATIRTSLVHNGAQDSFTESEGYDTKLE